MTRLQMLAAAFLAVALAGTALPTTAAEDEIASADDAGEEMWDDYYEAAERARIADPLKYWNVVWFHFNDRMHFWVVKPVAKGYAFVLPEFGRRRVEDFFINLGSPLRFVSNAGQGRGEPATAEVVRFVVNTTVGIAGFWDPAEHWMGLKETDEDFGQMLGRWKIGHGVFLTWPLFGPSSIRGTFGLIGDLALDLTTAVPGGTALNRINETSLGGMDGYETLVESAIDPYAAVRSGWVQTRNAKVAE